MTGDSGLQIWCPLPYRKQMILCPWMHLAPSERWTWPTSGVYLECLSMAPHSLVPRCPLSGPGFKCGGRERRALTLMAPHPPSPSQALGNILAYLSDAKRKLRQVVWINLREEVVLECDGHTHSLWPPGPALAPEHLEVSFLAFCMVCMRGTWGEGREPEGSVFLLYG
jgi:hypothetical protein